MFCLKTIIALKIDKFLKKQKMIMIMKKWVLLTLLLLLAACTVKTIKTNEPQAEEKPIITTNTTEPVKTSSTNLPEFKIIQSYAKRSPPSINGTVKNIGKAEGDVKITARVLYAGVVAAENTQIIQNIKPEEEAKFGISITTTAQWTSYSVAAEII